MYDARRPAWTALVPLRVLLVVAVVLGLCAMHVLAAAVSQHHRTVHAASVPMAVADSGAAIDASATARSGIAQHAAHAPAQVAAQATTQRVDHEHHHSMADCVLFLSAGITVLVILLAWAAARALRPSYWLTEPWLTKVITATPWRGPPPWHWPRISLCVIRV